MDVSPNSAIPASPTLPAPRDDFRAKPYSIERRFRLMQSATIAAVLLLVSVVLYWGLSLQANLSTSLHSLHTSLALDRSIDAAHDKLILAFWEAHDSPSSDSTAKYQAAVRETTGMLRRYDSLPLTRDEDAALAQLEESHRRILDATTQYLDPDASATPLPSARRQIGALGMQIDGTLRQLEDTQIRHLERLDLQMKASSQWLTLLLLSFGAFSMAATLWFRHAHRHHLWTHLESLRGMVAEVRRGNLDVKAEVPPSVELGALIGTFLEMARELQSSREFLEQKVAERTARLEATQKELLQSAKLASLGQLVSGVAHEINNPLTSILGFSEIALGRPQADPQLRGQLTTIREEALRLRNLVANLTSFARRAPHRTHLMDLRLVLSRLADLRMYQLQSNNVSLRLRRSDSPVWINGDPDQLLQVVLNLVSNAEQAIKDCRERGEIRLSCGSDKSTAWITVEDNGVGMTEDVREHAFDPFFTTHAPGQGTGLGLSISHGIIQQHHGAISVKSSQGAGTTMRIILPLAPEVPADPLPLTASSDALPAPVAGAAATRSAIGFRALVIDDEQDILEMVEQALERLDCRTTLLLGSAGVEAALDSGEFDIVLCDLKMPGQNGIEVYRLIRSRRPELARHFLLMTGNIADADQHAAELAAVAILQKPFTLARLRESVEQLLPKRTPA